MANETTTIVDDVKLALRISHNLLDAEIEKVIASAREEMIRAGVEQTVVNGDSELVNMAIKTYAMEYYTRDVKEADRYEISFQYQLDNLRKTFPASEVV